jgi:hypothetical protein
MLDETDLDRVEIVTSLAVGARRAMGLTDEAEIRREALAVAKQAVEENIEDLSEQESWYAAVERGIDRAIVESRES